MLERNQTLDEHSGGCDKCDRERDFGDYEHLSGAAAAAPREPASALPKRCVDIALGGLQRWRKSEQNADDHGQRNREEEDVAIDPHRIDTRYIRWR